MKVTKIKAVASQPTANLDPLRINERLYNQVGELLKQLENPEGHVTLKERVAALVAIGRIQTIFVGLRRERGTDEQSGSSVRKYAGAFKNEAGRGKKGGGQPDPEPDDSWFERAGVADDGDDAEYDA